MTALIPLVPGLVACVALALLLRGLALLRSDSFGGLDVQDLVLIRAGTRSARQGPLARLGAALVPALRVLVGPQGRRWLQRQIDRGGRPDGATVDTVLASVGMWIVIVSPAALVFLLQLNVLALLLCVAAVVVLPLARLSRARRLRTERLDRDLPDFLDVLSITVAAGVAFRPALARVADRFGGPLAEEMTLTLNQIATGASRRAAFSDLRRRNDSEALGQFVTAFLQSEELGAPLVATLQQIAVDMRRASAQRMRRRAARTAPRVTLVTSLVLVPGALILILTGLFFGLGTDLSSLFGGSS